MRVGRRTAKGEALQERPKVFFGDASGKKERSYSVLPPPWAKERWETVDTGHGGKRSLCFEHNAYAMQFSAEGQIVRFVLPAG